MHVALCCSCIITYSLVRQSGILTAYPYCSFGLCDCWLVGNSRKDTYLGIRIWLTGTRRTAHVLDALHTSSSFQTALIAAVLIIMHLPNAISITHLFPTKIPHLHLFPKM
jgi:hypothetical protein